MSPLEETQRRLAGCVDMIGRTGATEIQLRYSDDEKPVVWFAVASWKSGAFDAAAGPNILRAALRLCEQTIDGGECTHCHRPTGLVTSWETKPPTEIICWYIWYDEEGKFKRSCEGMNVE